MVSTCVPCRRSALHLAALSLIAWYPMVPPHAPDGREVNHSAPLAQWTIRRTFQRDTVCEAAKDRLRRAGLDRMATTAKGAGSAGNIKWCAQCQAECVATDDPRLKGK
jgi:hypothetical protein